MKAEISRLILLKPTENLELFIVILFDHTLSTNMKSN